jgi:hypothetical protein
MFQHRCSTEGDETLHATGKGKQVMLSIQRVWSYADGILRLRESEVSLPDNKKV